MKYNFTKISYWSSVIFGLTFFSSAPAFAEFSYEEKDTLGYHTNSGWKEKDKKSSIRLARKYPAFPSSFQSVEIEDPVSPGLIRNFLSGLDVGGYYRGFVVSRKMTESYDGMGANKVMTMGDGNYDPVLYLYLGGAPTPTTTFGAEVVVANPWQEFNGAGQTKRLVLPYYNIVLRGGAKTKIGDFYGTVGGIEWLTLTPFTFGANTQYQRYSIFERRPWDPVTNMKDRYASYYYTGTINQDQRFGTQAFKGFVVNGNNMPWGTAMNFFYGKTQFTGGLELENIIKPSTNIGGRISKSFGNQKISLNTFNSVEHSDSVNSTADVQWNIFTSEYQFNFKGIRLEGEIGYGGYENPEKPRGWSEGVLVDLLIPKKFTFLPISLRYYQIGQYFTSNVANFNNNSVSEVTKGYSGAVPVSVPFGGGIQNVGDMANNQRGFALNTDFKIWKIKFSTGGQFSSDIEKLDQNSTLTYSHNINNLVWSRFPGVFPFLGTMGPNQRVGSVFRGAFETINLTDLNSDGTPQYRRHFNSLDFQAKFKTRLFNKDFYWFYLGRFNSAQNKFSPVTVFSEDAYLRTHYHETEIYYQLHRNFVLSLYAGLETIKGNNDTELGEYNTPINQRGEGLGVGFDLALSNSTTVFFRQRWFSYEDASFVGEKFNGNEATIELKIYF